jgi:hypothetical protein
MLKSANGCSAHGNDATRIAASLIDGSGCAGRNGISLGVDLVILNALHANRLKSSQSYMQCDVGRLDPALANAIEDFWSEMKSGRGGGYRTPLLRIDGLIAFAIAGRILTRDVGREGHVSDAIENGMEIVNRLEANAAFTEFPSAENFGLQLIVFTEKQPFTYANLAAGTNQTSPIVRLGGELAGEQNLNPALEKIARCGITLADSVSPRAIAAAVQPGGKDAGIVEYQQIAGSK